MLAAGAVAVTAGCASNGGGSSPSPAPPATRSPAAQAPDQRPPSSQPSPTPRQAAEALQGAAAVPTAAQLSALKAEQSQISRLTPEQMAGQRVIYSYNGLSAPASLLSLISHGDVGGVIFFRFNISSQAQLTRVIAQLVKANASQENPARKFPLLLMTDQEGGQVKRLPWAGPQQSEAQIGASANPAGAAAKAGSQAASGLRAVGMNVNLAPVLDIFRSPGDFDDQFQRSYSMNPAVVSQAGAAFVSAQQAGGVAATLKHFPGLGDAGMSQNTDDGPVTINLSASTLRSVDELPYQAGIQAGAKLTMVSWANYPALDRRLPAGLSPTIIQGDLQRRLGFSGVTITDALGAGAISAYGSLQNKTMLAGRAGMEALLCTAIKPLPGWKCVDGLKDGFLDGALPKTAFEGQLAQLLELRASMRS